MGNVIRMSATTTAPVTRKMVLSPEVSPIAQTITVQDLLLIL